MLIRHLFPFFTLILMLGHAPILLPEANAQLGCCPIGSCKPWCRCTCTYALQACATSLLGGQDFTLETTHSGAVKLEADPAVLDQLKDQLKGTGKKEACGIFDVRLVGNVNNLILQCTMFKPTGKSPSRDPEITAVTEDFEESILSTKKAKGTKYGKAPKE